MTPADQNTSSTADAHADRRAVESLAARCRRRINLALLLERGAVAAATTLVAVGTIWIGAKMLSPEQHTLVPYALWSLVPVLLMSAWWMARSGVFFSQRDALVLADKLRRNDAELPSRLERPELYRNGLAATEQRLPRVRWGVPFRSVAPAAAYLLIVWAIPEASIRLAPPNALLNLELDQLVAALDEAPLAEEEREELLREIEELRDEDRELDRAQWEAIETVTERVDQTFEMVQREIAKVDMAAGQIQDALTAAMELPDMPTNLAELGEQLSAVGAELKHLQNKELQELIKKAASECKTGSKPGDGKKPSAGDLKKLQDSLKDLQKKLGDCEGQCRTPGDKPGNGERSSRSKKWGVNRGPGDADILFENEMGEFEAETDPNLLAHEYQDEMQEIGILHMEPDPTMEQPTRSETVTIDGASGPGGAVRRTRITPSRRDVIQRYFSDGTAASGG